MVLLSRDLQALIDSILPFVVPLSGGGSLRAVGPRFITTDFANDIEFFGESDGDFANAGVHAAHTAMLELRPFLLMVVVHNSTSFNTRLYRDARFRLHLFLRPAHPHPR